MADTEKQFAALPPYEFPDRKDFPFTGRERQIFIDSENKIRQETITAVYNLANTLRGLQYRRKNYAKRFDIESIFRAVSVPENDISQYIHDTYKKQMQAYIANDSLIDGTFDSIEIDGQKFTELKKMLYQGSFPSGWKQPSWFTCIFTLYKGEELTRGDLTTLTDEQLRYFYKFFLKLTELYTQKIQILESTFSKLQNDEKVKPYIQDITLQQKDTTDMIIPGVSFVFEEEIYDVFYKYNYCIIAGKQKDSGYSEIRLFSLKNGKIEAYSDMKIVRIGQLELYQANVGGRVRFFTLNDSGKPNFLLPFGLQNISLVEKVYAYGDGREVYKVSDGTMDRYFLIDTSSIPAQFLDFDGVQSFVSVIFPPGGKFAIFQAKGKNMIVDTARGYLVGVGTNDKIYPFLQYIPTEKIAIVQSAGKYRVVDMMSGKIVNFSPDEHILTQQKNIQFSEFHSVQYKSGVLQLTSLDNTQFYARGSGESVSSLFGMQIFIQ